MNLKIHHIGYLVKNLKKAIESFSGLGYEVVSEITHDEFRKIDICFIERDGYCVELVAPYAPDSVVSGLMKTHKNMPYHIAYCSEDMDQDVAVLRDQGFVPMGERMPAPAFGMHDVVFLFNNRSGMIELVPAQTKE